jgi:predicted transcriptional regulator
MYSLTVWAPIVISFIYNLRIDMCMSGFKLDPSQPGLRKILREWEELALRYVWSEGDNGAASRPIWENVCTQLGEGESISRASIIFFMNRLVDQGVLGFRDATGKGGHHKIYYPLLDETGYVKYVLRTIIESMMRDFPEEIKEVIQTYL